MEIVCLIITNLPGTRVVYDDLHRQWMRYINVNPKIKAYFIMFDDTIHEDYVLDNDNNTIVFKGTETYRPGIYDKTILAMKIVLTRPEFSDVKYVIRTNISAFWIWDRLIAFLKDKSRTNYLSTGFIMDTHSTLCPHGSNMIISRDVVSKFINDLDIPDKDIIADDVLLGILCKKYNITIIKYDWLVTTHIINPKDYSNPIKNIGKNVFIVRNNLLDPKLRDLYEAKKYEMLVDEFYNLSS